MLFKNIIQLTKMSCVASSCSSISNFAAFVQNGKKIIGAGINYNEALKVNNLPKPEQPIMFLKPTSSYITEGQDIIIPKGWKVNEEIELGVIIGKTCKNVCENDALDYVAGYCLALDLTAISELGPARKKGHPWSMGKGFDTACPVSRFLTKEEIPDPSNVNLWIESNGKRLQEGNTSDLIYDVPALISYTSKYMTLEPNDLILTGTPPGMTEIFAGDCVKGGIDNLITITFNVKSE